MFSSVIHACDKLVYSLGDRMRSRHAISLAAGPSLPYADTAIALAFAQRKDGRVNLPTQSIVEKAVQLHRDGLALRLIFSGSSHENGITEAQSMADKAKEMGIPRASISEVALPIENLKDAGFLDLTVKKSDMILLGQELKRYGVSSSYLVAHPLHLGRAFLLCRKMFPRITFYPIEAERLYDRESNQLRARAESFFVPWNTLAFVEHFIKGKI